MKHLPICVVSNEPVVVVGLAKLLEQLLPESKIQIQNGNDFIRQCTIETKYRLVALGVSSFNTDQLRQIDHAKRSRESCAVVVTTALLLPDYLSFLQRFRSLAVLTFSDSLRHFAQGVSCAESGGFYLGPHLTSSVAAEKNECSFTTSIGGFNQLSFRELEVLRKLAEGLRPKEIGSKLGIGNKTVESHILNARRKLGAVRLRHLVEKAKAFFHINGP
jgi:DNA-binding NarL/FixJ family response regulator